MKTIAKIYNGFNEKFGIPRQSGLSDAESIIEFEPEYRNADALRGLEEYSHLWLIWQFLSESKDTWSPTVRPPRLGGNIRMGVFATRSPNRPNPIGLSVVKIKKIELSSPNGPRIAVTGADLLNGTPILDIKPYIPYADSIPDALGGFAHKQLERALEVVIDKEIEKSVSQEDWLVIKQLLSQDPRPAYQNDPKRIYTMTYKDLLIRFSVEREHLFVREILGGSAW